MVNILIAVLSVIVIAIAIRSVAMSIGLSVGGLINASDNVSGIDNIGVQANPTVPAAQPATLTTRTTNTTGSLTMTNVAHGIVTGQRFDIYWNGGACYGAIAGTVAGTTVPIASVSGGSALPSAGAAVTIGIATVVPFGLTGSNLSMIAMVASIPAGGQCYFVFNNAGTDVYGALVNAGRVHSWRTGDTYVNPLAGVAPTQVYLSHNNTAGPMTGMQVGAVSH